MKQLRFLVVYLLAAFFVLAKPRVVCRAPRASLRDRKQDTNYGEFTGRRFWARLVPFVRFALPDGHTHAGVGLLC